MNILRWIMFVIAILFSLLMVVISPVALIGLLLVGFGIYQIQQKRKGKMTFSKPGWFITIGVISSFVIAMIFVDPVEQNTVNQESVKANTEEKIKDNESEIDAETAAQEDDNKEAEKKVEEQAKKEAEAKQKAEEQAKKEAEVKKKQEEALKKEMEEQKKQEEAKRLEDLAGKLNLEAATVARAVDGDTIELEDGRKVRLVGVNTPESTTRTEEYGKEASNYTASALEGQRVWLQQDVSNTDRYDRYLRLVWLDIPSTLNSESEIRKKMFNADLVLNGYAEPSTYNPDVKYSNYFVKFAREARENDKGLWAYGENGTTKGDLDPKPVASTSKQEKKDTNNSSSSSNGSSGTTSKQEYFQNCTELRKVYPNGVSSDHPAYASKHDRDKDNWACET